MPRGDGTGPCGQEPGTGGGRSFGGGRGRGGGFGARTGENCVCSACGFKSANESGVQCFQMKCPKCGAMMSRERPVSRIKLMA